MTDKIVEKILGKKSSQVDSKKIINNIYSGAEPDKGLLYKESRKVIHGKEVADDADDIVDNILGEDD